MINRKSLVHRDLEEASRRDVDSCARIDVQGACKLLYLIVSWCGVALSPSQTAVRYIVNVLTVLTWSWLKYKVVVFPPRLALSDHACA